MKKKLYRRITEQDITVFQFLIDRELAEHKHSGKFEAINNYRELLRMARVNISTPVLLSK
jgi:hypothetical protein